MAAVSTNSGEIFQRALRYLSGCKYQIVSLIEKTPRSATYRCSKESWSPWLYYGEWGEVGQIFFKDIPNGSLAFAHEGRIVPKNGECDGFQIQIEASFYENWSFNVAEAASRGVPCQIAYLPDFAALHSYLLRNSPVIVPITGWIPGGLRHFRTEHAICIIGYDAEKEEILCIDPIFPNDRATFVRYKLSDFLKIWAKHYNKAIIFLNL